MIEAVNSVLSNASSTRAAVEQQVTNRTVAVNPDKTQEVARAPYISPYISLDRSSNRAILQIRDSDTGDVLRQYPTESQLRAYRNAQETTRREEQTIGINIPDSSNRPSESTNIETTPIRIQTESVQTEA